MVPKARDTMAVDAISPPFPPPLRQPALTEGRPLSRDERSPRRRRAIRRAEGETGGGPQEAAHIDATSGPQRRGARRGRSSGCATMVAEAVREAMRNTYKTKSTRRWKHRAASVSTSVTSILSARRFSIEALGPSSHGTARRSSGRLCSHIAAQPWRRASPGRCLEQGPSTGSLTSAPRLTRAVDLPGFCRGARATAAAWVPGPLSDPPPFHQPVTYPLDGACPRMSCYRSFWVLRLSVSRLRYAPCEIQFARRFYLSADDGG